MSEATQKLQIDLNILEAMAAEMDEYLKSDVLFWPLMQAKMPRLTLGGYLMRQHRLAILDHLLDEAEQERLQEAMLLFNEALVEKVVRFEKRAHKELHARLRQWNEFLRDLRRDTLASRSYFPSSVETRVMIAALLDKMEMPPYQLEKNIRQQLNVYDRALRATWHATDFIWPLGWEEAYPKERYWYLYGSPGN